MFVHAADGSAGRSRLGAAAGGRPRLLVGPVPVAIEERPGVVLGVALLVAVHGHPQHPHDGSDAAHQGDGGPDRVGDGGEGQGYCSVTMVFTEALTPSASSTTTM